MSSSESSLRAAELRSALDRLRSHASHAGIFCDFDGALAEIVPDPAQARAVRGARAALGRLAQRFAVVAVVSGRPVSFLAGRIGVPGVRLVGHYGLETMIGRRRVRDPVVSGARPRVEEAIRALRAALADLPGVWIEDKELSCAVHFRRAAFPAEAARAAEPIVLEVARSSGLDHVLRGRLVLELAPAAGVGKGTAVERIRDETGVRAGLAAGDDRGDIAMMHALDGLAPALRIAVASAETPQELRDASDFLVEGPRALVSVFNQLSRSEERRSAE